MRKNEKSQGRERDWTRSNWNGRVIAPTLCVFIYSFASYCMKILAICELTCHTVWVSLRSGGCTSTRRCQWKGGATYQHHTGTYAREIFIVLTLHKIRYSVQSRHMFFKNNDLQFIAIPYISILYCKLMQDSMHLQSTPLLSSTFCNVL